MAKTNLTGPRDLRVASILAGAALIVGCIWFVYRPALHGEFILDDRLLLAENPLIHSPDGLYRLWFTTEPTDYWPVTSTTFWLEWRQWGSNPTRYHATNIALYARPQTCCLIVWSEPLRISMHCWPL